MRLPKKVQNILKNQVELMKQVSDLQSIIAKIGVKNDLLEKENAMQFQLLKQVTKLNQGGTKW